MPGKRRGKLPQTKIHVSLPDVLIDRIEQHMKKRGSATSVADFVRQSASDKIDQLEREERGDRDPVDVGALCDPIKAARRRPSVAQSRTTASTTLGSTSSAESNLQGLRQLRLRR